MKPAADGSPLMSTIADDLPSTVNGIGIADRIATSISLGLFTVGERLPTEIELARKFGVAVATLRKALEILRERELVVTRRGRSGGTFIVQSPFPSPEDVRNVLLSTSIVELRDLRDECIAVGSAVARLASARVWGGSVDRLRTFADKLMTAETPADMASADSRFHIELAVIAQSPRLMRSEIRLRRELGALLWSGVVAEMSATAAYADHVAIVDAVASGVATRAAAVTEDHLSRDIFRVIDAKLSLDPLRSPDSLIT